MFTSRAPRTVTCLILFGGTDILPLSPSITASNAIKLNKQRLAVPAVKKVLIAAAAAVVAATAVDPNAADPTANLPVPEVESPDPSGEVVDASSDWSYYYWQSVASAGGLLTLGLLAAANPDRRLGPKGQANSTRANIGYKDMINNVRNLNRFGPVEESEELRLARLSNRKESIARSFLEQLQQSPAWQCHISLNELKECERDEGGNVDLVYTGCGNHHFCHRKHFEDQMRLIIANHTSNANDELPERRATKLLCMCQQECLPSRMAIVRVVSSTKISFN